MTQDELDLLHINWWTKGKDEDFEPIILKKELKKLNKLFRLFDPDIEIKKQFNLQLDMSSWNEVQNMDCFCEFGMVKKGEMILNGLARVHSDGYGNVIDGHFINNKLQEAHKVIDIETFTFNPHSINLTSMTTYWDEFYTK